MDVRLRHDPLQPAILLRVLDDVTIGGNRRRERSAASRGHRGRLLVAGQQCADLFGSGHSGYRQKAPHNRRQQSDSHLAPPMDRGELRVGRSRFACPPRAP